MNKRTLAIIVVLFIIGCVRFNHSGQSNSANAISLSSQKIQQKTYELTATSYISEGFPNNQVAMTLVLELDWEDDDVVDAFQAAHAERHHWLILYLSDRKLNDFNGSANLKKMADEIRQGLADVTFTKKPNHKRTFRVYFHDITLRNVAENPPIVEQRLRY